MLFTVRLVIEGEEGQEAQDLHDAITNLIHDLDAFTLVDIDIEAKDYA